jgi:hypothetical protein
MVSEPIASLVMRRLLDRLEFTAKYGDTEWAASVINYIKECVDDVEEGFSGEQDTDHD